jgi:hypothetical protein
MLNSIPVAGFQCDFPGINIIGSDSGLLKENGYQTSNSASRILSFSMQATLIPVGEGLLTTVFYSDPALRRKVFWKHYWMFGTHFLLRGRHQTL